MNLITKKQKGFTIIELVISIFILSVAVVGVFSAFSVVTILTSDSADRLTATYLVQEGMEIVRNIRDTNWLNMDACISGDNPVWDVSCPVTWVDGLTQTEAAFSIDCGPSSPCAVDYTSTSMVRYTAGSYLYLDPVNGFYNQQSRGDSTKFQRRIIIEPVADVNEQPNDHIIKVTVQVSWDQKATLINSGLSADTCGAYNCIKAEGTLYNWYNYNWQ